MKCYIIQIMTSAHHQYPPLQAHYRRLNQLGEGSFGKVYLAERTSNENKNNENHHQNQQPSSQSKPSPKEYLAVKRLKPHLRKKLNSQPITHIEDFPQVRIMKILSHPNILELRDIVRYDKGYEVDHYLVLPFGIELLEIMRHKEICVSSEQVRCLLKQLVQAVSYLHSVGIMHRDIKPSNVYIMRDGTLRLGDFSIATNIKSTQEMVEESEEGTQNQHTLNVTTRNYRAPEIIYGSKNYNESIDIWGLGCTIGELLLGQVVFPGSSDINQLELIFSILGHPQDLWPEAEQLPYFLSFDNSKPPVGLHNLVPTHSPLLLDLLEQTLQLNPLKRPSAAQLLAHPYFQADTSLAALQLSKISVYLHEKRVGEWLKGKGKK